MNRVLIFFFLLLALTTHAQHKKAYKKFAGTITVIDQDVIKYDNELLVIYKTDKYLWQVFEVGLLFPEMFKDPGVAYQKTNAVNNLAHNFTVMGSQWINSKTGKVRLFKFTLLPTDNGKETEYFVELYNPKGTARGDFKNFLKGAQLVSLKPRG